MFGKFLQGRSILSKKLHYRLKLPLNDKLNIEIFPNLPGDFDNLFSYLARF